MARWRDRKREGSTSMELVLGLLEISPEHNQRNEQGQWVLTGYSITLGADGYECYPVKSWNVPIADMDSLKAQALQLVKTFLQEGIAEIESFEERRKDNAQS
jgi:hypothetical protein